MTKKWKVEIGNRLRLMPFKAYRYKKSQFGIYRDPNAGSSGGYYVALFDNLEDVEYAENIPLWKDKSFVFFPKKKSAAFFLEKLLNGEEELPKPKKDNEKNQKFLVLLGSHYQRSNFCVGFDIKNIKGQVFEKKEDAKKFGFDKILNPGSDWDFFGVVDLSDFSSAMGSNILKKTRAILVILKKELQNPFLSDSKRKKIVRNYMLCSYFYDFSNYKLEEMDKDYFKTLESKTRSSLVCGVRRIIKKYF